MAEAADGAVAYSRSCCHVAAGPGGETEEAHLLCVHKHGPRQFHDGGSMVCVSDAVIVL